MQRRRSTSKTVFLRLRALLSIIFFNSPPSYFYYHRDYLVKRLNQEWYQYHAVVAVGMVVVPACLLESFLNGRPNAKKKERTKATRERRTKEKTKEGMMYVYGRPPLGPTTICPNLKAIYMFE